MFYLYYNIIILHFSSNFYQNIKHLIWTFFIYTRAKLLNRSKNLLECLPLLIVIIALILSDLDINKFPTKFISELNKNESNNNINKYSQIIQTLCKKFGDKIDTKNLIEIKDLIRNNLFKEFELQPFFKIDLNQTKFDLNDDNCILGAISTFKYLYSKHLKFCYFDERIFLLESNKSDCSPEKLTPFRPRFNSFNLSHNNTSETDGLNTNNNSAIKKPFRNLFDSLDNKQNKNWNSNYNYNSRNYTNQMQEKSQKFHNMQHLTPCTRVVFMNNWVKEYISDWKEEKIK